MAEEGRVEIIIRKQPSFNMPSFNFASTGKFWRYALVVLIILALGFGVQVTLYSYLKGAIKQQATGQVLATTGTTSTATMISCCAHYLVNLMPILGVTGLVTFVAQYQVELFWVGLASNVFGIGYMVTRITKFKKSHE